ncbi:coiled-coil domain-containing protein mad1 [Podila humilis]|nr:coiled-coil domain-containing protein mad1 [Podila humilis]
MKVGGNAAAAEFFNKSTSSNKDAKTKYTSRVAITYKEKLEQRKAEDAASNPGRFIPEATRTTTQTPTITNDDDFFNTWNEPKKTPTSSGTSTPTSSTPPVVGMGGLASSSSPQRTTIVRPQRSTLTPKKSALGAAKPMKLGVKKVAGVNFEEAEARAKAEADRIAVMGAEAAEAERLEKKAAAERAAQRATDLQNAKNQPEAAKTRVNYYQANSAGNTPVQSNDDGLSRLGMGMGRMGFGSVPSGRSSNGYSAAPQPESTTAREKFGTQKAISSDQYFGRGGYDAKAQSEANSRLQAFSGATAISSSQYFGRDESQPEEEEVDQLSADFAALGNAVMKGADLLNNMINDIGLAAFILMKCYLYSSDKRATGSSLPTPCTPISAFLGIHFTMSHQTGDSDQPRRFNRSPFSTSSSSQPPVRTPFGEKTITPVSSGRQPVVPFWVTDNSPTQSSTTTAGRGSVTGHELENGSYVSRIKHQRTEEIDEIEQSRKKLKDVQFELSTTRTEYELKLITMEQKLNNAEIEREKLASRADELQSQRRFLFEKEKKTSTKYHDLEEQLNEYKRTSDETIRTLDDEIYNLKEILASTTERHRQTESQLSQRVQELENSLSYQEDTLTQIRDNSECQSSLAEDKHRQLSAALEKVAALELENRQLKQREQDSQHSDWAHKELQNQVSYTQQLEAKNRKLIAECNHYKETYRNTEVLKEEKLALQQKLKMLDDLRVKHGMLEVQIGVLQKEKQQWLAFLDEDDSKDFISPYELTKTIAALRRDRAMIVEQKRELDAAVKSRDLFIAQQDSQFQSLKKVLREQEEQMSELSAAARRSEQSRDLARRTAESLKEQLDSYITEEANLMTNYDNAKNTRIAALEQLVQEYQRKLETAIATSAEKTPFHLSTEMSEHFNVLQSLVTSESATFVQLSQEKQSIFEAKLQLENENAELRIICNALENKIAELELSIGAGAYNPLTSRILEINDSPAARHQAVRQHMLDSLTEENSDLLKVVAQLQRRLDVLSGGNSASMEDDSEADELPENSLIPATSFKRLQDDYKRLQEELNSTKKLSKRMDEIWETKSDEYLEAVEALLGYRFNFLEDGRVEVVSVYDVASEQWSFVFNSGENDEGTMQLVGTGSNRYMNSHREEAKRLLEEVGSIPAFLSQATLDAIKELGKQQQNQHIAEAHSINQRGGALRDNSDASQSPVVLPRLLSLGRRDPIQHPSPRHIGVLSSEASTEAGDDDNDDDDDTTRHSDMTMDMTMG